jgi:REP element-mobilizing transposase RayT
MARRIEIKLGDWYHCYNFAVERTRAFTSQKDYERFLLLMYLSNGATGRRAANARDTSLHRILTNDSIVLTTPLVEVGAYCIMPTHVHFVLKEVEEGGIATFMQKIFTGYTMYFNKRNSRIGSLFAGSYKAKHLPTDRHFKRAINYVHMNPIELYEPNWKTGSGNLGKVEERLRAYRYSSLPEHTGIARPEHKILGAEIFALFAAPTSLSSMFFDAQAYDQSTTDQ